MSESTCCTCGYTWPTGQHGGHSCTDQLLARVAEQAREIDLSMREASDLAMTMWHTHYADNAPAFDLCDSLRGVLSQIYNMYAGLRQELAALKQPSAGVDERAAFEAWYVTDCLNVAQIAITQEEVSQLRGKHGDYRERAALHGKWIGWQARAQLAAPAGVPDGSIYVEAVAVTRKDEDGELYLDWLLEGGISALECAGQTLLVAHGKITDDEGFGEVYTTAPASDVVPVPRDASIKCWSCGSAVSLDDRADADGSCPVCRVELDLEEYLRALLNGGRV